MTGKMSGPGWESREKKNDISMASKNKTNVVIDHLIDLPIKEMGAGHKQKLKAFQAYQMLFLAYER